MYLKMPLSCWPRCSASQFENWALRARSAVPTALRLCSFISPRAAAKGKSPLLSTRWAIHLAVCSLACLCWHRSVPTWFAPISSSKGWSSGSSSSSAASYVCLWGSPSLRCSRIFPRACAAQFVSAPLLRRAAFQDFMRLAKADHQAAKSSRMTSSGERASEE